ncbi:HipA N-terminal domain-containing protein [Musicola paradisiaca]|uniref:HipA N-terminal domain protein n=1 Tax=Musicola paradisiaca (strain Ech703) TaxID=579405 RepID=C6C776_MUSP7|nr:HipA N-terminal domain-containing protein [Musicola paradisiaca]ACS87783.1 HipA N-terminal domain protein [Musicola paradisiaca Ech703]
MADLDVYMNGYKVGVFSRASTGAHAFQYTETWLDQTGSRPISFSMPLRRQPYRGDEAYNFFDNLLPDNPEIRGRILARYHADSTQPFDLLARVGADTVGALQLLPKGAAPGDIRTIDYSVYPVFGGRGLNRRDAKLAMGLASSKGKKYAIEQIFPRHFVQTAKAVGFEHSAMEGILTELAGAVDTVIERVTLQLPAGFPAAISSAILEGLKARSARLTTGRE